MDPITIALSLAQFAPQIVKWVTGSDKSAAVAEKVVDIARVATGKATPAEILEELKVNAQAAADFQKAVMANERELEMAYLDDRQDARKMQIAALQQDDLFSKRFVYYFITAWSVFSMVFLLFVTFATIPQQNIRFVDTTLGFLLGTAVASMFAYLLGSTFRSQKKDDTITQLIKGGQNG